jgi:hypothetical protein
MCLFSGHYACWSVLETMGRWVSKPLIAPAFGPTTPLFRVICAGITLVNRLGRLTLTSSLILLYVRFLSTFGHHWWNVFIPVTGVVVCFIWYSVVCSYKDLNAAKFVVTHELEKQLPVALFKYEWHVCGKDKKVGYIPLTHLERGIPIAFAVLFVALGARAVFTPSAKQETQPAAPAGIRAR